MGQCLFYDRTLLKKIAGKKTVNRKYIQSWPKGRRKLMFIIFHVKKFVKAKQNVEENIDKQYELNH